MGFIPSDLGVIVAVLVTRNVGVWISNVWKSFKLKTDRKINVQNLF